jgi:hypothetical protein
MPNSRGDSPIQMGKPPFRMGVLPIQLGAFPEPMANARRRFPDGWIALRTARDA